MKHFKLSLSLLLILTMFLLPVAALGEDTATEAPAADAVETLAPADETATDAPEADEPAADEPAADEPAADEPAADEPAADEPAADEPADEPAADAVVFSYSDGIDENGYWAGIKALDYIELMDYKGVSIPAETHTITDEAVQEQIDAIAANYSTSEHVTDRAVVDGDTVNIDYVGTVDGVEFDGGSTGGAGTEVTIGVTSYIEGFLPQLVGKMPGETFDLNVTFPEDYGVEELNGKDAVFSTTINYIVETVTPEITDAFVAENLTASYGWTTIEEMKTGLKADMEISAVQGFLQEYIIANMNMMQEIPESLMVYQENALLSYYEEYAGYFGMGLDDFLTTYMGIESREALIADNYDYSVEGASFYLAVQAIAEDAGITVSDEDVASYFDHYYGTTDYTQYEEAYGLPYLKQAVLNQRVMDLMQENAVME